MIEKITRELEAVRRRGRGALVAQRLCQWLAALLAIGLGLGLVDFALRLPGWVRLVVGLVVAFGAAVWLVGRFSRAWAFRPELSVLALRAERLYPHLAGRLASAVEFAAHPEAYRDPQRTAELAARSVSLAERGAERLDLGKLIDPTRTIRLLAVALVAALVFVSVWLVAPQSSAIAAQRWFTPLAGVEWPRRTSVASAVGEQVWPGDSALRLAARVEKGHYRGMRVTAHYRIVDDAGPRRWQSVLLNEQQAAGEAQAQVGTGTGTGTGAGAGAGTGTGTGAMYDRLVDLPALDLDARPRVAVYFEAGDDRTEAQEIALIERPGVVGLEATVQPPAYAAGLLPVQRVSLTDQSGDVATLAALRGSTVRLELAFNKPLPLPAGEAAVLAQMLPGLAEAEAEAVELKPVYPAAEEAAAGDTGGAAAGEAGKRLARGLVVTLPLRQELQTRVRLIDEHGLRNVSERRYRLSVNEDRNPTASLVEPASDESVLAGAVVELAATGQDDVALAALGIEAQAPQRTDESDAPQPGMFTQTLARQTGRQAAMEVEHTLELAPLRLKPGDVVTLTAVAEDVFALDGRHHEPVRSTPRRLVIIDEAKLLGQLRSELAGVRQQAVRTRSLQEQTAALREADVAGRQQQRISERLDRQGRQIDAMRQRIERNQLDDELLDQLLGEARGLLEQAGASSRQAEAKLGEARQAQAAARQARDEPGDAGEEGDTGDTGEQAAQAAEQAAEQAEREADEAQAAAEAQLDELVDLLDQGRDAAELSMALKQMRALQEALAGDTAELLPQTVGRDAEDLPEDLRASLEALRERQQQLAEQAEQTIDRMESTAEALSRQSENERDQASAQSMAEAAAIARRQGLQQQMQQTAEALEQNRMSQAGNQQQQSLQTLEQMLEEMGKQKQRMQQMLRRRLLELANAIEQLLEQQKQQLAATQVDQPAWALLEEGQSAVRRRTMAVQEQARGSRETEPAAEPLAAAVAAQGQAILAMRARNADAAVTSEQTAIEQLQEALRLVRQKKQQMEAEQAREQRAELRQQYEALAKRQAALREQVAGLLADDQLTRRERADLVQRAAEQAAIRQEASALSEKVEQTLVFKALHQRVDEATDAAAKRMGAGQADDALTRRQQRVETWLGTMAAALQEDPGEPSDFAERQQPEQEQSGGEGGGQQPPDMIPPIAELKLMRALQEVIYQQTRAADQTQPLNTDEVQMLSQQQRELHTLGEQLIEKLQQQMQRMQPDDTDGKPRGEPR